MKKLSIVIPTIGRINALLISLRNFEKQIIAYKDKVELIVADNGSSDDTCRILSDNKKYAWLDYHRYEEQVSYFDSIKRAVALSKGEFVVLFGDDDIPLPYYVNQILELVEKYPKAGIYHYNVLIGKDFGDSNLHNISLDYKEYNGKEEVTNLQDLLYAHPLSMGFITSVVFSRAVWDIGIAKYNPLFIMYPHLFIWFNGIGRADCVYSTLPLAYGRMVYSGAYIEYWPECFFIEVPKLMISIDNAGITENLYQAWKKSPEWRSFPKFFYTLIMASASKWKYKPLCKDINKYQDSQVRKILTYLIIYFAPSCLYGFIRKKIYKQ